MKTRRLLISIISFLAVGLATAGTLRDNFDDGDLGIVDNVIRQYPNINILNVGDISTAINQFRLVILDRPDCSNFSNLLVINKPFIVFFDKKYHNYSELSQEIFDQMERVGLFHYDTKSAAEFINVNYKNPEKWWFTEEVQIARKEYMKIFANNDKNYVNIWSTQILDEYYKN